MATILILDFNGQWRSISRKLLSIKYDADADSLENQQKAWVAAAVKMAQFHK
jgi:hypothetical protein